MTKEGKTVKKPRVNRNYINGPDFHAALVEYKKHINSLPEGSPLPQIPTYIGKCIIQIAENLCNKWNFKGYSFRDEMSADAIQKMLEAVGKYDIIYQSNPNPFGYFSQVAWNSLLTRISKEKRESYVKHKNLEINYIDEYGELNGNPDMFNHEEHRRIIDEIESPKEDKKENYYSHKNKDYSKNRQKKKKKENAE